jgi:hypothetical protein
MSLIICSLAIALPNEVLSAKPPEDADKGATTSSPVTAFPKSIFVYRDRAGKDPFFPNRKRLDDKSSEEKSAGKVKLETLTLRGITGGDGRRVALINDRPFARGETGEVTVGTNTFRIRVIEIKEKSVTIQREGQAAPDELPLIENLLPITKEK